MSLSDLLARVEAATGPDRELDARLYVHLIARFNNPAIDQMIAERAAAHPEANVWLDGARDWRVKPYTASIDAALALAERVLPGWRLSVAQERHGEWSAFLITEACETVKAYAPTPALALIAAILKALIAAEIKEPTP